MTSSGRFTQTRAPVTEVHDNLDQKIIRITEDKLRLVLKDHLALIEKKGGWVAPLGLVSAIAITFPTTSFKDTALFKAPTWEAIFAISLILSMGWLIRAIYVATYSPSLNDVVDKIKNKS